MYDFTLIKSASGEWVLQYYREQGKITVCFHTTEELADYLDNL